MGTLIVSKKSFLDMLSKQIKDEEVIVFTNEMSGKHTPLQKETHLSDCLLHFQEKHLKFQAD